MAKNKTSFILADGRWQGNHGIARFSSEVLPRLQNIDIFTNGPNPLSMQNLLWQNYLLLRKSPYRIFFTPGFNAPIFSSMPFAITVHDLTHLHASNRSNIQKLFYKTIVKPAIRKARAVFTVSNYSKQAIADWASISPEKIINVSAGVSPCFMVNGPLYMPGFPYLLHVGNANKPHKNVLNMLSAFAQAKIDKDIKLILTGSLTTRMEDLIKKQGIANRVCVHTHLTESDISAYYRGAQGVIYPSIHEGFGLPVLEAMASGVPVLTSNITSLPEVAGDAAILVNPHDIDSLSEGIYQLVNNSTLRNNLISKGAARSKLFTWDKTAACIQTVLNESILT